MVIAEPGGGRRGNCGDRLVERQPIKKEAYHEESKGESPDEEEWIVRPERDKRKGRATRRR